ncbi:MAG: D-alanyl-D-alanine carboxypeptidase family protein [Clostridia bacterium]|nr:D-alanyl-D-alanine carboxypeptidase family protein [Clostridia bacterium]
MNSTPEQNKKNTAPPAEPKWNPYYRRNPDGTPGGHDRTLQQNAARADAAARDVRQRQADLRAMGKEERIPPREQQGLGQPVRRTAPPRVRSMGESDPMPQERPRTAPKNAPKNAPKTAPNDTEGARYRRHENGTMSRLYPSHAGRRAKGNGKAVILAAVLILSVALIIGIVAMIRGAKGVPDYTYDYNGAYTKVIPGEEAMVEDVPYLNMNYLAAIYGMTVSGSYEDMKFSTADGEYVSFMPDNRVTMVNGNRHVMSAKALLRGQEMWIPSDFVESMFDGIRVDWDHEKHTVTVRPATASEQDTKPLPLTFKLRPVTSSAQTENWEEGYDYLTDMTAFRDAIEPANRDAYLMLVNKENALAANYTPADLVEVTNMREGYTNTQYMCETAERALQALYRDLFAAGYTDVGVTSGYRTYKTQELLHEKYVLLEIEERKISRAEAEKYAGRYSALAGQSEHQTGLAVDMYNTASADASFGETEAYRWLKDHAHQYGFILRYPAEKTNITGYDFEPWHYRYVGRYHATQMYEQGLCLEEYLAKLG